MMIQSVVAWALAAAASLGIRDGNLNFTPDHPAATSVVALIVENKVHCSGVLIAEDLIVTAGHCIPTYEPTEGPPIEVYFGSEIEERSWNRTQLRPATEWASYYHPQYQDLPELLMLKDMGWIKFTGGIPEPAEGQPKLKPIPIAGDEALVPGQLYQIGGYGIDDSGISARRSGQVRFSHLPKFRTIGEVAMVDGAPSLPCPADSGSGLFAQVTGPDGGTRWALVGLASEIHFDRKGPPEIAYAQWSPTSQCTSAERATYVVIGDDAEWLLSDSKSYPVRVIPNDVKTFERVPTPTTLRELCEYPNALTATWLTATALIHAVRDQYRLMEPRTEGFCAKFEDYVAEHLALNGGEITLSLMSDLITRSPEVSIGQRQLRLDFGALDLVPDLTRLIVEPPADVRGVDTKVTLPSLKDLIFKGSVTGAESLARLNLDLLDITLTKSSAGAMDFAQLRQMGVINLTLENFDQIPGDLTHLTNLEHLTLRYTEEMHKPLKLNLEDLSGLKSLSLINYPEKSWGFSELPELRHLFVWGGNLNEIALGQMPNLVSLVAEGAPLKEFTGRLDNSQLRWISVRFSRLTELPEDFGLLEQLSYLDLKGNALTQLPESFAALKNLEFLNLSINEFTEFPPVLTNLRGLGFLDFSRNSLTSLLTSEQAAWTEEVIDYVAHDSYQVRYASFYLGSLSQRIDQLRSELGDFAKFSQRALY